MGKQKKQWTFEKAVKDAKKFLATTDSLEATSKLFRQFVSEPNRAPHTIGGLFYSTVQSSRWLEAIVLASDNPSEAWWRIHLVLRYAAFDARVYLEQLVIWLHSTPTDVDGAWELTLWWLEFLAQVLMTTAFAASIGEDDAVRWFGDWCMKNLLERTPMIDQRCSQNRNNAGISVVALWSLEGTPIDLASLGVNGFGPYWCMLSGEGQTLPWDRSRHGWAPGTGPQQQ